MLPHRLPARPPVYTAALRHARRLLCERLQHAACAPDDGFAGVYVALVAKVEAHLRQEEIILEACRVKRLEQRVREQRRENAAILAALHHTLPRVEDGDFDGARQLVAALTGILSLHRISADLTLPRRQPAPGGPPRMRGRAARAPHPAPVTKHAAHGARSARTKAH